MQKVVFILGFFGLAGLATGCSKSGKGGSTTPPAVTIRNGVNVSAASDAFNAYRTKGFVTYPAAPALVWNDTLSDAAFKFAKDIAAQGDGPGGSIYTTAQGVFLLDYPKLLGYDPGGTLIGECFQYPATSDVKTMIDQVFSEYTTFPTFIGGIMDPTIRKFGMGEFNNRWYLIASK